MADALAIAKQKVQDYQDHVMQEHHEAMDCLDCQEYLGIGILAYKWTVRAEETARAIVYEELAEQDRGRELISCVEELYRQWLKTGEVALEWIKKVRASGHRPENLGEFLDAHSEVLDRAERREWVRRVASTRNEQLAEEPW